MSFKISILFSVLLMHCGPPPGACQNLNSRIDKIYSSGDSNIMLLMKAEEMECFE
jgi:hypothetical protein